VRVYKTRRIPPDSPITDVSDFDCKILRDFPLNAETPLPLPGWTSGVAIVVNLRRTARSRSVIRLRKLSDVIVWKGQRCERYSIRQCHHGFPGSGIGDRLRSCQRSLIGSVGVCNRGINDADADSKHRFRLELVCHAQPRPECPWIVFREITIAASRSMAL